MKTEKPIRIVKDKPNKRKNGHNCETRVFAREIHETFCDDKKCKFYKQHAQQGICHTNKPDAIDWDRVEKINNSYDEELEYFRKKYNGKEYVSWLESMYICTSVNWQFTLDELIRLRRENALLKLKTKEKL
jgi:hypothetical protein